jgi:hypothetical protein
MTKEKGTITFRCFISHLHLFSTFQARLLAQKEVALMKQKTEMLLIRTPRNAL